MRAWLLFVVALAVTMAVGLSLPLGGTLRQMSAEHPIVVLESADRPQANTPDVVAPAPVVVPPAPAPPAVEQLSAKLAQTKSTDDTRGPDIVAAAAPAAKATRLFAARGQFPPDTFLAYGMMIFPEMPDGARRDRAMVLCRAFHRGIPLASELDSARAVEIVTIWPMADGARAFRANTETDRIAACDSAVDHYGQDLATDVLAAMDRAEASAPRGRGPYLVAWRPGSGFGNAAPSQVMDLSRVVTEPGAAEAIRIWTRALNSGTNWRRLDPWVERQRRALRQLADYHGTTIVWALGTMLGRDTTQEG